IDACQHLDLGPAHHRYREVGGCAAEHVGEDGHAFAAVHALDRFDDVLATLFDVVVGADRDRLDLLLGADHVLQRGAELGGEAPAATASRGSSTPEITVAPAAGRRSALSAARSTTKPTTAIGS